MSELLAKALKELDEIERDLDLAAVLKECKEVLEDHREFVYGSEDDSLLMYPDRKGQGSGECYACEDNWPCWAVRVSLALIAAKTADPDSAK